MEAENARRNLRDFLSMYNQFTETCFNRCIQNLNYRVLTPAEELCTSNCVSKLINVNHREISIYMEINPLKRRLEAADAEQELQGTTPDLALEVEKALGKDTVKSPGESASVAENGEILPKDSVTPIVGGAVQSSGASNDNETTMVDEKR